MFVAGMGTNVIAGNLLPFRGGVINLPGNAPGSASTIITGKRLGTGQISGRASISAMYSGCRLSYLRQSPRGQRRSRVCLPLFYTREQDVKEVVKVPALAYCRLYATLGGRVGAAVGFKGARDVRR